MQSWSKARENAVLGYINQLPRVLPQAFRAVVTIPVRDEAERICDCLKALIDQRSLDGAPLPPGTFGLILLANNCTDETVAIAQARLGRERIPYLLIDAQFAPPLANVGFARGVALELAAQWLERSSRANGVILTTDADSRVPRPWVGKSLCAIDAGCGAVAGRVRLQRDEMMSLSPVLKKRGRLENAYEQALLRLQGHIDPIFHDPWPNHWAASGANYALSLDAYRAIGGLPMMASGEDRALADALERHDIAIRHDPGLVVTTSARLKGRAEGGVAEALRLRSESPDMPGDDRLEPLPNALQRFVWRARLRYWHGLGALAHRDWIKPLCLPATAMEWVGPHFGAFWQNVEAVSPLLARHALRPSQLPANTRAARTIIEVLEKAALSRGSGNRADIPPPASAEPCERDVAQAGS